MASRKHLGEVEETSRRNSVQSAGTVDARNQRAWAPVDACVARLGDTKLTMTVNLNEVAVLLDLLRSPLVCHA